MTCALTNWTVHPMHGTLSMSSCLSLLHTADPPQICKEIKHVLLTLRREMKKHFLNPLPFEQRFLVGRFSLYKVCLVKCWRRQIACARRLFVGILRMLVNIFFCVGGVGGSVLS